MLSLLVWHKGITLSSFYNTKKNEELSAKYVESVRNAILCRVEDTKTTFTFQTTENGNVKVNTDIIT